jgi:hypothetical protein
MKTSKPGSKAAKEKKAQESADGFIPVLLKMRSLIDLFIKREIEWKINPKANTKTVQESERLFKEIGNDLKALEKVIKIKEGKKAEPKKQQSMVKKNKKPGKDI